MIDKCPLCEADFEHREPLGMSFVRCYTCGSSFQDDNVGSVVLEAHRCLRRRLAKTENRVRNLLMELARDDGDGNAMSELVSLCLGLRLWDLTLLEKHCGPLGPYHVRRILDKAEEVRRNFLAGKEAAQ